MNVLDKIIFAISPEWGVKREAWRQTSDALRNYDAGKNDRLNSGWSPIWNDSATLTDSAQRDTIRARVRDLERNSDVANGIISAWVRNVVGRGFTLQSKTEDAKLNEAIEKAWARWCKAKNCDVTGVQCFREIMRTISQRKYVDGGILIVKAITNFGEFPLQLQILEVDEFDTGATNPHFKGNTIVDGVETTSFGRVVGYHIKKYNADGTPGSESEFYDARKVIYYYSKTRPSQVREMSQLAHTISRIRDITSYMEAVSVKERIGACLAVFVKKVLPGAGGLGRSSKLGNMPGSGGYGGKSITPGMITELQPGDDIAVVNPPNQGGSATDFVRLQQRLSGAGQGLSYETTSRDMSQVNYSSARQGLIEDERTYGIEQDNIVEHVLSDIYESFITLAVMSGDIDIPGFWDDPQKYLAHTWAAQGRKWIDPQKEANANRIAMQTAQKTFQQVCLEQGLDWKDVLNEWETAQQYAKEKGIDLYAWIAKRPTEQKNGTTTIRSDVQ